MYATFTWVICRMVFWKDAIRLKIIAVLLAIATIVLVKLQKHNEMEKTVSVKDKGNYEILISKVEMGKKFETKNIDITDSKETALFLRREFQTVFGDEMKVWIRKLKTVIPNDTPK
jgi:hypothetical protein